MVQEKLFTFRLNSSPVGRVLFSIFKALKSFYICEHNKILDVTSWVSARGCQSGQEDLGDEPAN